MVMCAEKEPETLDLDGALTPHPTSCGLRHRRPQRGELSQTVGTHPGDVSAGSVLYGFLGSIPKRHPGRTAYAVWQRQWSDRACRTVEQYTASATGALRQKNLVLLEVRPDARDLSAVVFAPLQSLTVSHLICPLPLFRRARLILLRFVKPHVAVNVSQSKR